jgi:LCP family protein required for cell wall assembly
MASRKNNRNGRDGPERDIDRYDQVDRNQYGGRDIYSSSSGPGPRRRRKKKRRGRKILAAFLSLLVLLAVGLFVYANTMLSRINRDNTDPQSYVQLPSDAPSWDVAQDKKVTNILLIGTDREKDGLRRSDSMMLVSIDNQNKKLHLTSFLRDLYLEIPTVGKDKLNASFSNGGAALTMQTIENNFRVNVDRYVQIDVDSFAEVIDKMGGIDVVVNKAEADEMNRVKHCNFSAGKNHMRGTLAVYYARMRIIDTDFARTGRQRQVIRCMIDKLKTRNPIEMTGILYDYLQYVKTNLTDTELISLAAGAMKIMDYPIDSMHIPNTGTYQNLTLDNGAKVLDVDLEKNCAMLRKFIYGTEE